MSHTNTDWNTDNLSEAELAAMESQLELVAQQQINYQKPLGRRYSVGVLPSQSSSSGSASG